MGVRKIMLTHHIITITLLPLIYAQQLPASWYQRNLGHRHMIKLCEKIDTTSPMVYQCNCLSLRMRVEAGEVLTDQDYEAAIICSTKYDLDGKKHELLEKQK